MHSSRMRTVRNSSRLLGLLTESQTRVKHNLGHYIVAAGNEGNGVKR